MTTRTIAPTSTRVTAPDTAPGGSPRLRLVPGGEATQLSLPYEYDVAPGVPAVPTAPPHLRSVTHEEATAESDLPDIRRWAAQMARAIAESWRLYSPVARSWAARSAAATATRSASSAPSMSRQRST